jgi:UDP-GlcNAc:undecaprenyl-phosphate/decaprenyl-phosphate GlcNAc-1-phosphate transferase
VREYLFVLVMAAAVTYVATPLVRWFAFKVGALNPVRERDMHAEPMPRLGGVGMFLGFAAAVLLAWKLPFLSQVFASGEPQAVLLGATLVCVLGVIDDLRGLDAMTKLAGQLLAAGVMAYQGIQLLSLPLFGVTVLPTPLLVGLTVLVVVVTINAVNFVDGLDGLAAGIVGIAAVAFFTYSYLLARSYDPNVFSAASLITAALIGCCAGFLPHNFNPARIFMGDSGSMLLGLLLAAATISLTGNVDPANVPLRLASYVPILLPIAVLLLPSLDLVLAVIRRTRAGQRWSQPDTMHLHHRLLAIGHSHAHAVLIMYLWTAVLTFGAASFAFIPARTAIAMIAAAGVLAALLTVGVPWLQRRSARRVSRSGKEGVTPLERL